MPIKTLFYNYLPQKNGKGSVLFNIFLHSLMISTSDTTVGSAIEKFITMISVVLGIAIVALPAGIIIAGYQDELKDSRKNKQ